MVTSRAADTIRRVFGRAESVSISTLGRWMHLESDGVEITVQIGDASAFPPIDQVIPEPSSEPVIVESSALSDAVAGVARVAHITGGVLLTLEPGGIRVEASSPDRGEASDSVACEVPNPGLKIGMNSAYLIQVLAALASDTVEMSATRELEPIVMSSGASAGTTNKREAPPSRHALPTSIVPSGDHARL
jgi:DNA polymerase III sliding clamp (beta) subunit (PCNA family)